MVLDLIIDRLNEMSDSEIVEATNYKSKSNFCDFTLEGHDFYYYVDECTVEEE